MPEKGPVVSGDQCTCMQRKEEGAGSFLIGQNFMLEISVPCESCSLRSMGEPSIRGTSAVKQVLLHTGDTTTLTTVYYL